LRAANDWICAWSGSWGKAGEQQFSIYVRHGWTGKDERLIDPATLSRDPNTSVSLKMFPAMGR
jgi:hypothetical protein